MTASDSPASPSEQPTPAAVLQSTPHPYYNQAVHGPYQLANIGDFVTESGATLRSTQLAYVTHGTLNPGRTNAVLMTTWYSGTSKIMEQIFVGPGRALDPEKYFIVIVNQLASGLGTSPHNTPLPWDGPNFPQLSIADDVRAQHTLLTEHLGITQLALVVGGSMGAQQTYEWAVRYPDMVKRAAPIAGFARNTDHDRFYGESLMQAVKSDPGYAGGRYKDLREVEDGMRRHVGIWAYMGLCPEFYRRQLWKPLGFASATDFVNGFVAALFLQMDPGDLMCKASKWQRGDVSLQTGGDLGAALGRVKARVFVMPISTDQFFPVEDCRLEQQLIAGSELRVIESNWGHFGLFAVEPEYNEQIDRHLNELLALEV